MTIFDELETQYNDINTEYEGRESEARRKGWVNKETLYRKKRKLNDQAYFLFMFTRLEEKIKTETEKLIKTKKASIVSWKQKRAWNILFSQFDRNRLNFLYCLELSIFLTLLSGTPAPLI